ncbi:Yqey-like protein-domain-containing protein [Morchella snyderi]|nr:Yqey-like protein-domain-containing protein [Morchella snyderi]
MLARTLFRRAAVAAQRRYTAPAQSPSSSSSSSPPLLGKIRSDMKDAMRAKDTNRLNVCRSLIAEISNASKTPTPPTTDIHLLAIITKTLERSHSSLHEFQAAGRADLAAKEAGQIGVLQYYAAQVDRASIDEIDAAIKTALEDGAAPKMGELMKAAMARLEGRPMVRADVAGAVQRALKK